MGVAHRGRNRSRVAQIGLHRMDLADLAERLQMPGQFRPPHRDADAVIALGQRPDDVAAEKARSSENRDEGVQIRCHGVSFLGVGIREIAGVFQGSRYANRPALYSAFGSHCGRFDKRATDHTNRPGPRWRNW